MVSAELMAARLRAYYAAHNPGNDQNIAEIVRKFQGKEAVLCAKLQKKYGVAPDLNSPEESTCKSPSPANVEQRRGKLRAAAVVLYDPHYKVVHAVPSQGGPLDFRSSEFDALEALRARGLEPLVALRPLDNIHKCRHLLPESDPNHHRVTQPKKASTTTGAPAIGATAAVAPAKHAPRVPSLFEALADTYLDGPFTVLRRCFLQRKRVRVVIRRVNSVRGTCAGFLKAFDKHMNLVLQDVTQSVIPHDVQTQRDLEQARARNGHVNALPSPPLFSVADARQNRAFTEQAYAKQLFVRGDNVVMVMEDSAPSRQDARPAGQRK